MRYVLLVLSLFAAAACAEPRAPRTSGEVAENFRAVLGSVAALVEDGKAQCSGVWHRNKIVTAAHCVEGEGAEVSYAVFDDYSYDGHRFTRSFPAEVVRTNDELDLALLEPGDADSMGRYRNLLLAEEPPHLGQRVFAVGHAFGIGFYLSEGRVVAELRRGGLTGPDMPWIGTNLHLYPGMSGGPLLTDDAEVLGINSFRVAGASGVPGHIPVSAVRSFLSEEE